MQQVNLILPDCISNEKSIAAEPRSVKSLGLVAGSVAERMALSMNIGLIQCRKLGEADERWRLIAIAAVDFELMACSARDCVTQHIDRLNERESSFDTILKQLHFGLVAGQVPRTRLAFPTLRIL